MTKYCNFYFKHKWEGLQDMLLLISGLPPHPGPPPADDPTTSGPNRHHRLTITHDICNITSMDTYLPAVLERGADICCLQEISIPMHSLGLTKRELADKGISSHLTRADPEHLTVTGGVGALTSTTKAKLHTMQPTTSRLRQCHDNGRNQLIAVHLADNRVYYMANVYGWTNGHSSDKARHRTDCMLTAIFDELEALGSPPFLLVGDLPKNEGTPQTQCKQLGKFGKHN